METVVVALLVSVIAPIVLGLVTGHQRRADKREDWAREDRVAARAAEVANKLLAKQVETAEQTKEAAKLLVENNQVVAETAEITNEKLDIIHTLVNSNMTAALQGELDSARAQLVTLRELIGMRVAQGEEPDKETLATLHSLESKVDKLAANLKDRLAQTKVADAQIFIAKKRVTEDKEH